MLHFLRKIGLKKSIQAQQNFLVALATEGDTEDLLGCNVLIPNITNLNKLKENVFEMFSTCVNLSKPFIQKIIIKKYRKRQ